MDRRLGPSPVRDRFGAASTSLASVSRSASPSTAYAISGTFSPSVGRIAGKRSANSSLHTHTETSRHLAPTHPLKIPPMSSGADRRKHDRVIRPAPHIGQAGHETSERASVALLAKPLTLFDLASHRLRSVPADAPFVVADDRPRSRPPVGQPCRPLRMAGARDFATFLPVPPCENETRGGSAVRRAAPRPEDVARGDHRRYQRRPPAKPRERRAQPTGSVSGFESDNSGRDQRRRRGRWWNGRCRGRRDCRGGR